MLESEQNNNIPDLDDIKQISKIDSEKMLKYIQDFPQQCENFFEGASQVEIPSSYKNVKNIIICGMGGSAIGGSLVKSLIEEQVKVPIIIKRDYNLPGFVDSETLVLAVSYSGNTEEPLTLFREAQEKKAKLLAISTNGELEELADRFECPLYKFSYNSHPRAALGYIFTSILSLLSKIGIIKIDEEEFKKVISHLEDKLSELDVKVSQEVNLAKKLAFKIYQSVPVIYAADFLDEVSRRWKTQFNENSKNFSFFEVLPELNHNAVVGYDFPEEVKQRFFVILLISEFYHPRNRIRFDITKDILYQKDIPFFEYKTSGQTLLTQLLTTIYFGDFVSFYLAILNNTNPTPIETIDYLKDRLDKQ